MKNRKTSRTGDVEPSQGALINTRKLQTSETRKGTLCIEVRGLRYVTPLRLVMSC